MLSWILVALLFLCSGVVGTVRSCDWLRQYGNLSNNSMWLLTQMGGEITDQECPVSFPESFYRHVRKAESGFGFIDPKTRFTSSIRVTGPGGELVHLGTRRRSWTAV
ncbi:Interferon a3 [Merluccius polli]|uniref:Interferon a3 n=1 Tax=Merluccius polli TaxID=89951 RepID=A0AA47MV13_MERPO|nr:Interferon a3 [Merluccius polli]